MEKGGRPNRELAGRYFDLFVNRTAFTVQSDKPDGKGKHYYFRPSVQWYEWRRWPERHRLLCPETILRHLAGEITVALYAINPKTQRCKWIAIDADYPQAFEHLLKLQSALRKDGVDAALERSRRGAHLWMFAASPLLSRDCRLYTYNVASRLAIPIKTTGATEGIEVFPRQDELDPDEFGNAIRGPLGVHRGAGKRYWFYNANYSVEAQLTYLDSLNKITEPQLAELVQGLSLPEEFRPRPKLVLPPFNPNRREFHILEHVSKGRRSGKDYRTRCPSCAQIGRDENGDNLAIKISDPRKYKCWAGCRKEEIRAALGCPIRPRMETTAWQPRVANP
jgi:hypothetical protein